MRDLVPQPGIEPWPPALGVQSLTHWTTKEVPPGIFESCDRFKVTVPALSLGLSIGTLC